MKSILIVVAMLLSACAREPRPCEPTRTLYVVNHGWHSGIVVETEELLRRLPGLQAGNQKYLEIGWGEERFYRARDAGISLALRAVLWPNASVLHVVEFDDTPRRYFAQSEVVEVRTDEAGYEAALGVIAETFKRTPGVDRLGQGLYGSGWFYRAEGSFHLSNTCNTWSARVLEAGKCN